ncbi:Transducin/WD40 repeat-like superfamily protein [Rhynchospora pubera]|uniref:Transducin/WD40 repeat-like superfamily protein n=1 Tax=Rhynchospora pubera TaxID=906938 RepID=A0AAV8CV35_9POAL|nr:Transducin/WD40 repeat-like superfamily protein [Rhynchospora pubera]
MQQARSVRRQPMISSTATISCMPRLRRRPTAFTTPMSLFNRLREVLLRLIMISSSVSRTEEMHQAPPARVYHNLDSHRSEAVQDCIEFFKRSAVVGEAEKTESSDSREELDICAAN